MNGLHNLVTARKVFYLVLIPIYNARSSSYMLKGLKQLPCLDLFQGKHVRSRPWQDSLRDLPRKLECSGSHF